MTREEILFEIEFYKSAIKANGNHTVFLKEKLQDYEKQLAELEVEVYRGWLPKLGEEYYYITLQGEISSFRNKNDSLDIGIRNDNYFGIFKTEEQAKQSYDRHMAGEELKKIISEENAKQGWKVNWENHKQPKRFMYYDNVREKVSLDYHNTDQHCENELYFSEQSSKDQEFLDKIEPLWLKWKGIE